MSESLVGPSMKFKSGQTFSVKKRASQIAYTLVNSAMMRGEFKINLRRQLIHQIKNKIT